MRRYVRMPDRGIYTSAPQEMLDDRLAFDAQNVRFRYGVISNRAGTTTISTIAEQPLWFGRFFSDFSGTNINFTLMLTNSFLYRLVGTVWTKIDTFDSNPFPGTGRFGVAIGEGKIFVTRKGMGHIQAWNGNTAAGMTRLSDSSGNAGFPGNIVPGARFLEYFNVRLIEGFSTIGGADKSTRIQWCVNANSGNWDPTTTGGFLDLTTSALGDEQAEPLTGIKALAGRLACYKRHSIVDIIATGLTNPNPIFTSEVRIRGIGCAAPYTLVSAGQTHFFLGQDNVYSWDGIQVRPIGDAIQKTLLANLDVAQLNSYFGAISIENQEYYLVLNKDILFVYDYARDTWTRDTYPSTSTVSLSALGSADVATTAFNWSGAPAPIVGTWLQHAEAWSDINITGTPALLGAGPQGASFGTFYQDRTSGIDYDGSYPLQFLVTKAFALEDENPWDALNIFRILLKYGANNGLPVTISLAMLWDVLITGNSQSFTPITSGHYSWIDFNMSGSPFFLFIGALGGIFEWQSLMWEYQKSGEQLPITQA